MHTPRTIVLGVSGGIAAYKTPELVRQFRRSGVEVQVVLTASAQQFVTPLALQTVSGNSVHCTLFSSECGSCHQSHPQSRQEALWGAPALAPPAGNSSSIDHIALARMATAIVVAPATANIIAKVAHGLCDDLLTTIICATTAPVYFAPAMNVQMWHNKITQRNVQTLRDAGYHIIEPTSGDLACGEEGIGRMAELETIVAAVATGERHD